MASFNPDGSILTDDRRTLFADDPVTVGEFAQIAKLLIPQKPPSGGWPFISGGGGGGNSNGLTPGGSGTQGAQGAPGGAGAQGAQGPGVGAQGAQGSTGAQGVQGPAGAQGAQGVAGSGAQGAQGSAGAQGTTGAQGAAGSGAQGAQGSAGAQGATGAQGSVGAQGSQGITGAQGAQGPAAAFSVGIFTFTHASGTASTGALGFTPKFAIYSGVADDSGAGADTGTHFVGLIVGIGGLARSAGIGVLSGLDFLTGGGVTGDDDSAGGLRALGGGGGVQFDTTWVIDLDVTAFSSLGIDLTWSAAGITDHRGQLLVVG